MSEENTKPNPLPTYAERKEQFRKRYLAICEINFDAVWECNKLTARERVYGPLTTRFTLEREKLVLQCDIHSKQMDMQAREEAQFLLEVAEREGPDAGLKP